MIRITAFSLDGAQPSQVEVGLSTIKFPGGEVHVTVKPSIAESGYLTIHAHLDSSDAIMELLMVTDALKRAYPHREIVLKMPYVPYARQDRVANPGEAHSIKVFCNLINAQNYHSVIIQDPHSDVTSALLDRVQIDDPRAAIGKVLGHIAQRHTDRAVLVSPDAGARKRVQGFAKHFKLDIVYADKIRNPRTGEITGTEIHGDMPFAPLLIVDDICDGGRTFIELAKAIRAKEVEAGITVKELQRPLYLYVTHGIFSKGLIVLTDHFDEVFTSNNWISDDLCVVV
jgi:ribose-phosphate pyrophosphokinase